MKSAPNESASFLTKAREFFKLKKPSYPTKVNMYRKPKDLFPNEIYPDFSKPSDAKTAESKSSPLKPLNQDKQCRGINNSLTSPRVAIKRYKYPWMKQINTENPPSPAIRTAECNEEEGDEEGVFSIELIKHHNGYLGIILVGGTDTPLQNHYVNDILPSSSASKSGRVRVGDELLEVNGHKLRGGTHAEALRIFRVLPSVVKLVVVRRKDANRSVLKLLRNDSTSSTKNNNLSSPNIRSKKKSLLEAAADTSVLPKSVSSVVDVTTRACSRVTAVKRVSRCSSFVGSTEDDKSTAAEQSEAKEVPSSMEGNSHLRSSTRDKEESPTLRQGACPINRTEHSVISTRRSTICGSPFYLPPLDEGNAMFYSNGTLRDGSRARLNRYSMIHSNATWPTSTAKQRQPFPWELTMHSSMRRHSSARDRRSVPVSCGSAHSCRRQHVATRKLGTASGKNCLIEKETMTVEIFKDSVGADWGFIIGGGLFSPYGDLPIHVVEVSEGGPACGILKRGDEIAEFSGDSFGSMTLLEAERIMGRNRRKNVTVTVKRKFLQRTNSQRDQSNPYAAV